jgi:mono/diheme cytochrome c family protein
MKRLAPIVLAAMVLAACGTPPGKPVRGAEVPAPEQVLDFATLFAQNCAGCHGNNGEGGAALPLSNPAYLALADANAVRKAIAEGVRGTPMPAFAKSAGGMLTEQQVDVIANEMRSRWSEAGTLAGVQVPSYATRLAGDAERGAAAYKMFCESCHGANGQGGAKGSSIVDPAFLTLVSDQGLRTTVILGRPDLGAPDWRGDAAGRAMTDQEVTDVVAWLSRQRPEKSARAGGADKESGNVR